MRPWEIANMLYYKSIVLKNAVLKQRSKSLNDLSSKYIPYLVIISNDWWHKFSGIGGLTTMVFITVRHMLTTLWL